MGGGQTAFIDDFNGPPFKITASYTTAGSPTETPIPAANADYLSDFELDEIQVNLQNNAVYPINTIMIVSVWPVINPPSLEPLSGFQVYTGDKDFNVIEQQLSGL